MHRIINKIFHSVTYILPVGDSRDCWLIDCGDFEPIEEQGLNVQGILLTHTHFDHIYGLNKLMKKFPSALIYTNEEGFRALANPKLNLSKYTEIIPPFILSSMKNVRLFREEGNYQLSPGFIVNVLFTPGHDSSCISYLINDSLFTGDAYIPGVKTVTNLSRGDKELAGLSIRRILSIGHNGVSIYAGHDLSVC